MKLALVFAIASTLLAQAFAEPVEMIELADRVVSSGVNDTQVGKYTIAEALKHCRADPNCGGLTFNAKCDSKEETTIFFKAVDIPPAALFPGDGWCSFVKQKDELEEGKVWTNNAIWATQIAAGQAVRGGGELSEHFGEAFASQFDQPAMLKFEKSAVGDGHPNIDEGMYTVAEALGLCTSSPACVAFTFANQSDPHIRTNVWFKNSSSNVDGLMSVDEWTAYVKPRRNRKPGVSYHFAPGDKVRMSNRGELLGEGAASLDALAVKKMEWPGGDKKWKADSAGGKWINAWFKITSSKPQKPEDDTHQPMGTYM